MGALSYLFFARLRNQVKEFVRKPSKLIMTAVFALAIGVTLLADSGGAPHYGSYRSIEEFYAVVAVLYGAVFVTVAKNGFSNGGSVFSMADVNLIFVSPVKASSALFFGMLQQLGKSLYLGVFLLFQYTLAREYYGIEYTTLILVAFGYGITALFSQMTATLIYMAVSSSDRKTKIGKAVFYGVVAAFIGAAVIRGGLIGDFTIEKAVYAVRSTFMYFMPVSGFVTLGVEGAASGEVIKLIISLGTGLAFSIAYYILISKARGDYYEDVLLSAQTYFSAVTAAKEGKAAEVTPKNVRVGREGLTRGYGASAVSEKHKTENRRSRVLLLDKISLVITAMLALYSFILPSVTGIFVTSVYTLTITVAAGRWAKELAYPYIYLIPEKPFKKLVYLIREQIPSVIIESIICFIPVHFILKTDILLTLSMMAARAAFGLIFIGANLVFQRLFSSASKTVLTITLYMLFTAAFSMPAIICGVLVSFFAPFNPELSLLATVPVNAVVSAVILFAVRNVLQYSEYNNR
ncbi:MAG: putative ABC exporter domain-containing protein [Clostridia bacterium]|nr:putative ABC exporter domain-containing protein [Clostridia bacterium]